jgi:ribosomal protein L11 methyltransferase
VTTTAEVMLPQASARALADTLADLQPPPDAVDLAEKGNGAWAVTAYFSEISPLHRHTVERAVINAAGPATRPEWRELPETDWVKRSQSARPPVTAGRFIVFGEHDRDRVPANAIAIHIEAGLAFGTGHHGTTRGCLVAIGETLRRQRLRNALDVGTGSGVLAIALAKSGVAVTATDIDPVAVAVAKENARQNGVAKAIRTILMPPLRRGLAVCRPAAGFDLVVANILMDPLLSLAPAIATSARPGGTVILSGLLPHQRQPIVATYRLAGLRLRRWFVLDGWLTIVLERPRRFTGAAR